MSFTSEEYRRDELRAMGKQRILLVDDEPDILDFIEYNLVKEGYDVHTANNGNEGVALAKKLVPDLILLDVMMPEMDGFEFANEVKKDEKLKDIPIFVVTALDLSEEESELLAKKAQAVILKKTMSADSIADQISKLVNSQKN